MRLSVVVSSLVVFLALAGCESAEDRAERHYQSGLALVAAGDADRALVELRNVFRLNGRHREARRLYAELMLERGEVAEAGAHLLRLVEEFPDDVPARAALAEFSMARGDWDEARRHVRAGEARAADDPAMMAASAALAYRDAVLAGDEGAEAAALARAEAALEATPDALTARRIVADARIRTGDLAEAVALLEPAIAARPDLHDLAELRLQLLYRLDERETVARDLEAMVRRHPGREAWRNALVALHVSEGGAGAAEAMLRRLAALPETEGWARTTLVDLIAAARGPEAARAEVEAILQATDDPIGWGRLRAEMMFREGEAETALAEMQAIVATPGASGPRLTEARLTLARMLIVQDRPEAAREHVAAVLAADPGNVEALSMRARWAIEAGRPAEAIVDLRRALTQAPRDADVMTLLAEAHLQDGARELAGERLSLAVEVSGRGTAQSLRYADFLIAGGRIAQAERVLLDARQLRPQDADLIAALADLRIARGDGARARADIAALRALGPEQAGRADRLELRLLEAAGQSDAALARLRAMLAADPADTGIAAALVARHLARDDAAAAMADLGPSLAANPEDPALRLMVAGLHRRLGDMETAEAGYRALLAEAPLSADALRGLVGLLVETDRATEARETLAAARAAAPRDTAILRLEAGLLHRLGDWEGAIAGYEALVAAGVQDAAIRNNLAVLLASARWDAESLARAVALAEGLEAAGVPQLQATAGFTALRDGDLARAAPLIEAAAEALPDDAAVLAQLGLLQSLRAEAEAAETLRAAIALAEATPPGLPPALADQVARVLAGGAPDVPLPGAGQ